MPVEKMTFEKNDKKYWDEIRRLRNKLNNSGSFIEDVFITESMQEDYMNKNGNSFFVCLVDGKFSGYIGVIDNDIRIAVDPEMSGRGIGQFMLKNLGEHFPEATAKILPGNEASKGLFEKSGFKLKWYYYERDKV